MTKAEVSNLIKSLDERRMEAFRVSDYQLYDNLTKRLDHVQDEYFDLIAIKKSTDFKMEQEEEFRQKTSGHFNWELFLGKVNKKQ